MTKRILAFVIVLAMVLSVLPVQMVAAEQTVPTHGHSDAHQCSSHCPGGTITWKPWGITNGSKTTFPTESGHYYLECDVTLAARADIPAGKDITICLNGWTLSENGSGNISYLSGYLTISDCTAYYDEDGNYVSGQISGCSFTDGGAVNVRRGGKLVMESGKITGNTVTGGGGAVSIQSLSGSVQSGAFYMLGGEITGNSAVSGGAIVSNNGGNIYLQGGKIYGNTDKNGGADIYVVGASSRVNLSGAPVVGDIYFDNASNPGLQVAGLTAGAKITADTKNASAAVGSVIQVTGTQESWDCHWVTLNGQSVDRADGAFRYSHTHCEALEDGCTHTQSWTAWKSTADKPLPTTSGYYYLTSDVNLTTRWNISGGMDIKLCLNGYDIVQKTASQRVVKVYEGGKLTVTDHAGGAIMGGTSVGTGGGAIWAEDATDASKNAGTSLKLYNITVTGGATGYGGGVYALHHAEASLTNVTLKNCTATQSGGGVSVRDNAKVTVTGCTFTGNTTGGDGGGMYAHKGTKITIADTDFTGNKATGAGGGFGFGSTSVATVTDITSKDNESDNGAGLIVQGSAQVSLAKAVLEGNAARLSGGGIYLTGTTSLVAQSVTVTGNTATRKAAGLYWDNLDSGLTVKGDTVISGNVLGGADSNLYMNNANQMLTVSQLGDGASIGISNRTGYVSTELTTDWSGKFRTDDGENSVILVDNRLYIGSAHRHCPEGKTDCGHEQVGWTKWTSTNSLPTASGNYYLSGDVTLTSRWNVSAGMDIQLCLNGFSIRQTTATQRAIKVYEGGKLTVTSCAEGSAVIGGTNVGTGGGAIWAEDATDASKNAGTSLKLYNITVTGGTTGYGGGIYILNNADVTITNVTVTGSQSTQSGGGVSVREGGKLTMTGCTFTGNTTGGDGGGLYAHKNTQVTMTDTTFTGNKATGAGGGLGFGSTSVATIARITANGNQADNGGGMIVQGSAQVTASEMTLKDNVVRLYGSAIYVATSNSLTLQNAEISGNTASGNGGIYVIQNSTLNLASVQITGNQAQSGGGLYACAGAIVSLEGTSVIRSNQAGNLYLTSGTKLQVKNLASGSSVAVTAGRGAFTEACDDYTQYFISDSAYQMVEYIDGALHMVTASQYYHKHCLCDGTVSQCDHSNVEWDVWDRTDSLPASGYYYLLADVQMTGEQSISSDLHLCLNGHTVRAAENKRIFSTPKNTKVTISISDCQGGGMLTGGVDVVNNTGGGAIFIRTLGTLELYGGIITGNKSITAAGGILLAADTTFNMYGGEISNNGARDEGKFIEGGGVYAMGGVQNIYGGKIVGNQANYGGGIYSSGNLNIYGGLIDGNYAAGQGGGVICYSDMTIAGGQITNNTAVKDGGGAYGRSGKVLITGGTISGNVSQTSGGGIGFSKKAQVTMTGGTITNNKSPNGGGMIVQGGASLEMTGGTISDNQSTGAGGGIYVYEGSAKISGGTVSGNNSVKDGGGIYLRLSTAELSGELLVSNNKSAKGAGGAVCFSKESSGKITGGTYEKCSATNAGAIVIQSNSSVEMSDAMIRNNRAETTGGAIYVMNSTLNMTGGTVTGNTAVKGNTGGIYMDGETSVVKITGGSITYNTSKKDGAGVYGRRGLITLSGMYIAGNKTSGAGGGTGVTTKAKIIIYGGVITGNEAVNGGGIIIQGSGHLDLYGGTISGNKATNHGGGLYVHQTTTNIYGGTFQNNEARKNGGGAYFWRSTIKAQNASFCDNHSGAGGGGFTVYWTKFEGTKLLASGNTCDSSGGGVLMTKISEIIFTDSIMENNSATNAGGLLIQTWTTGTVSGLIVRNNEAYKGWGGGIGQYTCTDIDYYDCEVYGNSCTGQGGGIYMQSARGSNTPLAYADLTNVKIFNNTAGTNGGGMCAVQQIIYSLTDCQIFENTAAETGGGLAHRNGAIGTFKNLEVTGNQSGKTGSGIWISDNTDMCNVTVTGNKTPDGSAVYYADSDFDGQSYVLGLHKMSGNIRICDNEGSQEDLYIGEKTTIAVKAEGLGEDTLIRLQLHSGILTNTLLGSYNYEGGDQIYTVTYGDRSVTEPEYEEPTIVAADDAEQNGKQIPDGLLYGAVALFAVAVIAVAAVVIGKKKKTKTPEANKE